MEPKWTRIVMIASAVILLFSNRGFTIEWAKTYGNYYYASSIQQTTDGGYIVAGHVSANTTGGDDAWLMKVNADGTVAWAKSYGDTADNRANSVQQTPDGGFIVVGYTDYFYAGGLDLWIFKLNSDGSIAWQKVYGGGGDDVGESIQPTSDGGYIVTGWDGRDLWVLKLDTNGNSIWAKTYVSTGYGGGVSIQQTLDGGYVVAAVTTFFNNGRDFWVVKLNRDGNLEWQKAYGGPEQPGDQGEIPTSIQQTADGGYIVVGSTGKTSCTQAGCSNLEKAYVLKLDSNGGIQWQKTYGGPSGTGFKSVQQTPDGGFIVAGYHFKTVAANSGDAWLLKLNLDGSIAWQKTYEGFYGVTKIIRSISGSGYIVLGGNDQGIWILKLDDNGDIAGCPLIGVSNVTVNDTNIAGQDVDVHVVSSNVIPKTGNATSANTSVVVTTQCSSYTDEVISSPILPGGPTDGTVLVNYTYSTGSSFSNQGHPIEYRFDWGDGSYSSWSSETSAAKAWGIPNIYSVKAQARCAIDTYVVSNWSSTLTVKIDPTEAITIPLILSGPTNGNPGVSYLYATGGSSSNLGHSVQYLFDWGDGTNSGWLSAGTLSASKFWTSTGNYVVKAKARCVSHTSFESSWSAGLSVSISLPAEIISISSTPSGPSSGFTETSYSYSTGGSSSNLGHSVEYQFDWKGNGSDLSPWGAATQSKAWSVPGTYNVKARARCATDTSVVSEWSSGLPVTITAEIVSSPSTPSGPTSAKTGISYTYTTGGSSSTVGHSVEYQFDWKGDGSDLSKWGPASQPKTWATAGVYNVRARARCVQDVSVVSDWSNPLSVSISVPDISVTPTAYNFGNVKVKKSKTASFFVKNNGTVNLTTSLQIIGTDAPMFKITSGAGSKIIKPGKTLTIKVVFKPTSTGPKSSTLRVTSNDPDTATIDIPLSGTGQ